MQAYDVFIKIPVRKVLTRKVPSLCALWHFINNHQLDTDMNHCIICDIFNQKLLRKTVIEMIIPSHWLWAGLYLPFPPPPPCNLHVKALTLKLIFGGESFGKCNDLHLCVLQNSYAEILISRLGSIRK